MELRVIHVQNWPQAADVLTDLFNLHYGNRRDRHALHGHNHGPDGDSDGDGYHGHGAQKDMAGFSDWAHQKAPTQRAGKPLLQARTWRVSADPWRRITRCAVGLDTLRRYPCRPSDPADPADHQAYVASLSAYDANDIPFRQCNIYAQRFAMYGGCPLP